MTNYYSLLKISPSANSEEIEQAFEKFKEELLKYNRGIKLSEAEIKMQCPDLWEAYEILLDPVKRQSYNESIKSLSFRSSQSYVAGSGSSRTSRSGDYRSVKPSSKLTGYESEIYILKYAPPVLMTRVARILAYVIFGITAIVSSSYLLLFITVKVPPDKNIEFIFRIILLVVMGLCMFFMGTFLKRIYPHKEIIFKGGNLYIQYPHKPEDKITKITLYKHRKKDIIFMNADTQNEIVKFYCGQRKTDPYRLQMNRYEIMEYAKKASVFVAEERFILLKQAGLFQQRNVRK